MSSICTGKKPRIIGATIYVYANGDFAIKRFAEDAHA